MLYSIRGKAPEDTPPWNQRYASLNDASEALRVALGWPEIVLAPGFSEDGGQEWKAYANQAALQAGSSDAPRVRREGVSAPVLEP